MCETDANSKTMWRTQIIIRCVCVCLCVRARARACVCHDMSHRNKSYDPPQEMAMQIAANTLQIDVLTQWRGIGKP